MNNKSKRRKNTVGIVEFIIGIINVIAFIFILFSIIAMVDTMSISGAPLTAFLASVAWLVIVYAYGRIVNR